MKKSLFTCLLILCAVMIVNAQTNSESRKLKNFNIVKVSNAIKAELLKGDENKIEITVTGIEMEKVETNVNDRVLTVGLSRGNFKNHSIRVVITYQDVQGLEASTSASIIAKNLLEGSETYLFATTNGYIEAEVSAEVLRVDAATNAKIFVSGSVEDLDLKIFTNGEVDGENLQAENVTIQANTAAKANFDVSSSIIGSAATGARVTYGGSPKNVDVKTSTGGTIQKR